MQGPPPLSRARHPLSSDFAQHLSKSTRLAKALGNFGELAQPQQFIGIKIDRFVTCGRSIKSVMTPPPICPPDEVN